MNLPNKLTLARMAMAPLFLALAIPLPELNPAIAAYNRFMIGEGWFLPGIVYALAFATDALDGYIARSRNLITDLGKFMDPLADKILVAFALFVLVEKGDLSSWIAATILARELAVTGFRAVAAGKGVVLAAEKSGKLKTVFQFVAITLYLFEDFRIPALETARAGFIAMLIALALTLASGAEVIIKNRRVLSPSGSRAG